MYINTHRYFFDTPLFVKSSPDIFRNEISVFTFFPVKTPINLASFPKLVPQVLGYLQTRSVSQTNGNWNELTDPLITSAEMSLECVSKFTFQIFPGQGHFSVSQVTMW